MSDYDTYFERGMHLLIVLGVIVFVIVMGIWLYEDTQKMEERAKQPPAEWQVAPQLYTCTAEQSALVEKDTLFCDENTSFFSSYCYGTAIMRNCAKKETAK